jgi:hypothetical protein
MSHNRRNHIGQFLVGMGLEVAAAILYVPTFRREIRQTIKSEVDAGREFLAFAGWAARHRINNWINAGRDIIGDIDTLHQGVRGATAEKRS